MGDAMWQSSPPGSIYDYIKVASFSIGADGLVDQWSLRAEQLFGISPERALGMDPIEAFFEPDQRERGQRKMAEILDGREWTGVVPFRMPADGDGEPGAEGLAEVYVMPTTTEDGERAAVCIVVDVRTLRSIETDLAASQAIFGQSPFGFLLIDTDLRVRRANKRFASVFGGNVESHRGRTVHDYLPRSEGDRVAATLRRVLETGDSITDMHVTGFIPGSDERRHWSINLYRVHSGTGRPIGIAWLGTDITSRGGGGPVAGPAPGPLGLLYEGGGRRGAAPLHVT
ncbi:PAS domain-containing protein, partial [Streptomyces sp. NPDC127044]